MFAARPQFAVAVDVDPLPTEGLAEEGVVEGGAAGHGVRVERVGGYGGRGFGLYRFEGSW